MIEVTRDRLLCWIELLAERKYGIRFEELKVQEDQDYCEVICIDSYGNSIVELSGTLAEVYQELEDRWLNP